jgi:hypothetical protein
VRPRGAELSVIVVATLLTMPAVAAPLAPDGFSTACDDATAERRLAPRLRLGQYVDVHQAAVALDVLCPPALVADRRRIVDALALIELDESARARAELSTVARASDDAAIRARAELLVAWAYLREGDDGAFRARLDGLPLASRARLALLAAPEDAAALAQASAALGFDAQRSEIAQLVADVRAARRTRRPWLAGVLSAVLPGAGQVYAGSWQAAAVSFVLNGALIGATVELAQRRLYLPAGAAGLAASFFYVGNVFNAVDLAGRRNDVAAEAPSRALEERLVPEAHP